MDYASVVRGSQAIDQQQDKTRRLCVVDTLGYTTTLASVRVLYT